MSHHRNAIAPMIRQSRPEQHLLGQADRGRGLDQHRAHPARRARAAASRSLNRGSSQEEDEARRRRPRPGAGSAAGCSARAGSRARAPRPASTSVITLIALVSRNSTAERSATRGGSPPRSTSSQAPTATLPAPPSETAAPNASSLSATRAPNRERRAIEHLQEGDHVADAGEDLQHDREHQPAGVHVADLVGHAVQARHRQQQADHHRHQDGQRDQPAPQAAARVSLVRGVRVARRRRRGPARRRRPPWLTIQAVTRIELPGRRRGRDPRRQPERRSR